MISIKHLTENDKERRVIYTSKWSGAHEEGTLKKWNDEFIFVSFNGRSDYDPRGDSPAKACSPDSLSFKHLSEHDAQHELSRDRKEQLQQAFEDYSERDTNEIAFHEKRIHDLEQKLDEARNILLESLKPFTVEVSVAEFMAGASIDKLKTTSLIKLVDKLISDYHRILGSGEQEAKHD